MPLPQTGIFALGTLAHAYLEFDLAPGAEPAAMVAAAAGVAEPRTTMGGVNLVTGIRPELWAGNLPPDAAGFETPVVGPDGYTMPATQHDLMLWVAGPSYDVVFDVSLGLVDALAGTAVLADETVGWSYHRDLDLTGFIDGTENPALGEAPAMVLVPDGTPGAGGTVLLLQKWAHEAAAWTRLPEAEQERVIGRTKRDSVELADRPATSHAARTDQDEFGHIFRRNTPYGSVLDHGTMFVGFSAARRPLHTMLESMAGVTGERDALTRYSKPLTGAYYFVPSLDDLATVPDTPAR
ncbi:Dyp-type peroxidase [Actinophytocola sp.]|uniref:Dyp-type peroxidase n=1 Tax=Actinophytocola sp. TaxID=1872138 RepID=UPI002D23FC89|nr:Dyp-type peroxidase [Actinophytocola sp.]HYQ67599.1 Dyp-type peroxidase [Actinophytocola sp.]